MSRDGLASLDTATGSWFRTRSVTPQLDRIDEPHVDDLLRANIWHLRGRDRDLVVDTGLGVASLRACLPTLFERDPLVVLTHAHLDHMGGAHEFHSCTAHPGEPFESPPPGSLEVAPLLAELGITGDGFDLPSPLLIDALPYDGYDVDAYRLRPAAVDWVTEGSRIDLGDREFTVVHLPGHTPASIGLLDERTGVFFSGDVIYDDVLIDDCCGSDVSDYRHTMRRLLDLDVDVVHAGHGDSFGRGRLREIATDYLERTDVE